MTAVDRFRALVMADPRLQRELASLVTPQSFRDAALGIATAHGLDLPSDTLDGILQPDPIGLSRWTTSPVAWPSLPDASWLPVHVVAVDGQVFVDWAYFGDKTLSEPFYEDSLRRMLFLPFNRFCRLRTPMTALTAMLSGPERPDGFIFHMSRCGSTLVGQMLGSLPACRVVSEAAPINTILQFGAPSLEAQADWLAAMVLAYCRGPQRRTFVKLDSWHVLALPLFRRAFPTVPWVFLYREPVEVLVSQARMRGAQAVPGLFPPALFGIAAHEQPGLDEYCARMLATICRAAADQYGAGGGLLVNYNELPKAVWTEIMPHFSLGASPEELDILHRTTERNAKAPSSAFSPDSGGKQQDATSELRALAGAYMDEIHARLEALRQAKR